MIPPRPLPAGRVFRVEVRYAGVPADLKVDSGHVWQEQDDGGAFVNGEPHSGTTWLPLNDHPSDKASYDVSVTVPREWEAVAPGDLVGQRRGRTSSTWHWRVADPMPSYQLFLGVGQYELRARRRPRHPDQPAGVLVVVRTEGGAADPRPVPRAARVPALAGAEPGRYPFHHLGMVVQDGDVATLESLGAAVYGRYIFQFSFPTRLAARSSTSSRTSGSRRA